MAHLAADKAQAAAVEGTAKGNRCAALAVLHLLGQELMHQQRVSSLTF